MDSVASQWADEVVNNDVQQVKRPLQPMPRPKEASDIYFVDFLF